MPVILDPDTYDMWLDPGMNDVSAVSELLKPFDGRLMRCYQVSTRINHVANVDAKCSPLSSLSRYRLGFSCKGCRELSVTSGAIEVCGPAV
jgi:SOS response associated peptidase (SRAP)